MRYRTTVTMATWLVTGMAIGTVAAFLTAPVTGKKARRQLMKGAKKSYDFIEDAGRYIERAAKAAVA